jgi:hypothetical protein
MSSVIWSLRDTAFSWQEKEKAKKRNPRLASQSAGLQAGKAAVSVDQSL